MEDMVNEAVTQNGAAGSRIDKGGGKGLIITLGVLAGLLAASIAGYVGLCAYADQSPQIWKNTYVLGQDIGGLTPQEAASRVEAALPHMSVGLYLYDEVQGIPAQRGDPDAEIPFQDLNLNIDVPALVDLADKTVKQGSFLSAGWRYLTAADVYYGDSSSLEMDPAAAEALAEETAAALSEEVQHTSYEMEDDQILVTIPKDGRTVDARDLAENLEHGRWDADLGIDVPYQVEPADSLTAQEIHDAVAGEVKNAGYDPATNTITPEQVGAEFDVASAQKKLDAADPGEVVAIPAVIEEPAVTADDLRSVLFRDVLGEATTHVSGTAPRINNVRLAAAAFNGTIMNTGDVFSYNESLGRRTEAKGYGPASAYIQGETVDVIGGGICQGSSTLYLACLLANLEITERYAHRYVLTYITKGMDATVSWGGPDYKFTNNTDYPIKLVAFLSKNNDLTVQILGTKTDDITVKMTYQQLSTTPYETVYEDDPTLPAGTETVKTTPYTGYRVKSYRNLYDGNGNLISSTFEASSDYKARNQVILRGPAASTGGPIIDLPVNPAENTEDVPADIPPVTPPPTVDPGGSQVIDPAPLDPVGPESSGQAGQDDQVFIILPSE